MKIWNVKLYRVYEAESNHTVFAETEAEAQRLALLLDGNDIPFDCLIEPEERVEDRQLGYCEEETYETQQLLEEALQLYKKEGLD